MKRLLILFSILFVLVGLTACTSREDITWHQAMTSKLKRYDAFSTSHLEPFFKKAKVRFPPSRLAFLIFKRSKRFEVYAKSRLTSRWVYIKTFPVLAASGGPGPKLHSGDDQVPEGVYHIVGLNPESRFDLSMHLNYPNAFDRRQARRDGRRDLGGDIYIHGNKRSIGCIAIGDFAVQQLFPLVYRVGIGHVTVIIAPDDLRRYKPVYGRKSRVKWLPRLYARLERRLKQFPLPR